MGAEVVPQAVDDAIANARRNHIENARFLCADAGRRPATWRGGVRPDVVCVDPPRKGLAEDVVDTIADMGPERVVYVSCDPGTLGRDVKRFAGRGYTLKKAVAVDMFPAPRMWKPWRGWNGAEAMAEERHICALLRRGLRRLPPLETPIRSSCAKSRPGWRRCWGVRAGVPILGMEHPWHYRNKAISTFCTGPGRRLDSGIYAAGTHRVVPVASCLLHHPALDEAVEAVRQAARLCRYEPYQEDRGTGLVRHVLVRHSRATGRVLVALVTAAPVLPGARAFVSKVRELCPRVETIVQNINPRRSSAVLGPREKVLWGRGYIEDTLCGVRFRLGASSFYQINPEQTEVLYRTALDGRGWTAPRPWWTPTAAWAPSAWRRRGGPGGC